MKLRIALFLLAGGSGCNTFALPPVIDNSAYPPNAAPAMAAAPAPGPSGTAVFELMARMEQMQADIQQLTGKVEEQANQIAELKKKQASMYNDFDERLQGAEGKAGGAEAAVSAPAPDPMAAEAPQEQAAPPASEKQEPIDSAANLAAVAQGTAASQPTAANQPAAESAPQTIQASGTEKQAYQQASGTEKQAYQNAYTLLRTNRPEAASAAFKAYLLDYPNGGYAANAQYGLGEAYRLNKDNTSAQQAFADVLDKYPNTAKVPDALYMLGVIAAEQNNTGKAQEYFNRVVNEFPNAPAAHKAAKKMAAQETPSH